MTEKTATSFWVLAAALKEFVDQHGVLPLSGQLPDMTSDSERYHQLLSIYRTKALQDAKEVYIKAKSIMNGIFDDDNRLTLIQCQQFCKHAAFIGIQTGTSLANEAKITVTLKISTTF